MLLDWKGVHLPGLIKAKWDTNGFAAKKVKVYYLGKWYPVHRWASAPRPGSQWPLGHGLDKRMILTPGSKGSWGHGLYSWVRATVGGSWSLNPELGPEVSRGIVLSSFEGMWWVGSLCLHGLGVQTQLSSTCYL